MNLILQNKSNHQIFSDGVEVAGSVNFNSYEMQQREFILTKCLQFLKLLAKYTPLCYDCGIHITF